MDSSALPHYRTTDSNDDSAAKEKGRISSRSQVDGVATATSIKQADLSTEGKPVDKTGNGVGGEEVSIVDRGSIGSRKKQEETEHIERDQVISGESERKPGGKITNGSTDIAKGDKKPASDKGAKPTEAAFQEQMISMPIISVDIKTSKSSDKVIRLGGNENNDKKMSVEREDDEKLQITSSVSPEVLATVVTNVVVSEAASTVRDIETTGAKPAADPSRVEMQVQEELRKINGANSSSTEVVVPEDKRDPPLNSNLSHKNLGNQQLATSENNKEDVKSQRKVVSVSTKTKMSEIVEEDQKSISNDTASQKEEGNGDGEVGKESKKTDNTLVNTDTSNEQVQSPREVRKSSEGSKTREVNIEISSLRMTDGITDSHKTDIGSNELNIVGQTKSTESTAKKNGRAQHVNKDERGNGTDELMKNETKGEVKTPLNDTDKAAGNAVRAETAFNIAQELVSLKGSKGNADDPSKAQMVSTSTMCDNDDKMTRVAAGSDEAEEIDGQQASTEVDVAHDGSPAEATSVEAAEAAAGRSGDQSLSPSPSSPKSLVSKPSSAVSSISSAEAASGEKPVSAKSRTSIPEPVVYEPPERRTSATSQASEGRSKSATASPLPNSTEDTKSVENEAAAISESSVEKDVAEETDGDKETTTTGPEASTIPEKDSLEKEEIDEQPNLGEESEDQKTAEAPTVDSAQVETAAEHSEQKESAKENEKLESPREAEEPEAVATAGSGVSIRISSTPQPEEMSTADSKQESEDGKDQHAADVIPEKGSIQDDGKTDTENLPEKSAEPVGEEKRSETKEDSREEIEVEAEATTDETKGTKEEPQEENEQPLSNPEDENDAQIKQEDIISDQVVTGEEKKEEAVSDHVATGEEKKEEEAISDQVATGEEKKEEEAISDQVATGEEKKEEEAISDQVATGEEKEEAISDQVATGEEKEEAISDQVATGEEKEEAINDQVATGEDEEDEAEGKIETKSAEGIEENADRKSQQSESSLPDEGTQDQPLQEEYDELKEPKEEQEQLDEEGEKAEQVDTTAITQDKKDDDEKDGEESTVGVKFDVEVEDKEEETPVDDAEDEATKEESQPPRSPTKRSTRKGSLPQLRHVPKVSNAFGSKGLLEPIRLSCSIDAITNTEGGVSPGSSPSRPLKTPASPRKIQKSYSPRKKNGMLSPVKTPKTPDGRKLPPIKAPVGLAPNPNLKNIKSKIGSFDNIRYKPGGGDKKVVSIKLEWKAAPKIGSWERAERRKEKNLPTNDGKEDDQKPLLDNNQVLSAIEAVVESQPTMESAIEIDRRVGEIAAES